MSNYPFPVKNTAYIFYVGLIDQSNTKVLKANPTLASGDFQVSIDGGAFANLGTLPTVTPAAGTAVKVSMASGEMNGDNIVIACIDAAGAQWCDQLINIQTATRGLDDLAFPATSGRSIVVDASGLVDANMVKAGPTGSGTAQTAGDIPGRLPAALTSNGNMKSSMVEILTTALTETAGQLAGGFKKFFNIATPASTMDALTLVATATVATTATNLTNAPTAGDFTAAMKTSLNAATPASVVGAVGSVTGAVGSVTGNVGGNVGGNVTGSAGSVIGAVGSVTGAVGSVTATVNADIKKVNGVTVNGDGSGTPWGP